MASQDKESVSWVARAFAGGAIKATTFHIFVTYVIPIGIPLVTGYLGHMQGHPWMYIVVGMGLMFASITSGMVRFDDWTHRRQVKGKLGFSNVRFLQHVNGGSYALGIDLVSSAAITMEVEFSEIRTQIGNTVPHGKYGGQRRVTVESNSHVFCDDSPINIAASHAGPLQGLVEFDVKYGRPGSLRHRLSVKKNAMLTFDANGLMQGNAVWYNPP